VKRSGYGVSFTTSNGFLNDAGSRRDNEECLLSSKTTKEESLQGLDMVVVKDSDVVDVDIATAGVRPRSACNALVHLTSQKYNISEVLKLGKTYEGNEIGTEARYAMEGRMDEFESHESTSPKLKIWLRPPTVWILHL
jgi:hypothetical protein